jgi:hypothetical protein
MRVPRRLVDEGALPPSLRVDLARVRATPYRYDARAGLAALQAALALTAAKASAAASAASAQTAAPSSAAPGGAAAALLGPAGAKLGLAAAGAAVLAASWFATAHQAVRERALRPAVQRSGDPPLGRPAPERPALEPERARGPSQPRAAEAEAPAAAEPSPAAREAGTARELRREIAQLGRIKALLARDPALAYRLAQQGHRAFARGMLRHEREGLAVLALFDLGRRPQAARRAHAFLARYPDSPLRGELERLLGTR